MSVTDELERYAAIRRALGLPENAEVTQAPGGGYMVRVTDEQADLAQRLDSKLGGIEGSRADTFVEVAGAGITHEDGTLSITSASVARGVEQAALMDVDEGGFVVLGSTTDDPAGNAADRERYVTERAEQLARAFEGAWGDEDLSPARNAITRAFRDLIDRGVLK